MRQHLEAVLFEDRAARASRVHGDVADAAVVGFPQPGRKKGGVEAATAELGHGRTAPQAGEGPGSGEPDPAAGSWGFVDVRHIDRDAVGIVRHFVGKPIYQIKAIFAVYASSD